MKHLVLGVDGGNTKTHYTLFDEDGAMKAFLARGSASHEALPGSYDAMEDELRTSLRLLLKPLGLEVQDVSHAVLGLAGTDTEEQHAAISDRLQRLGLCRFRLVNDAFLGIKAGTESGIGVCSINGTGTVAAGLGPRGSMAQVGGHGFFSGDEGGGPYLAERVIRAVYDAHFRCGPATFLTDLLLKAQGTSDVETLFPQWIAKRIPVLTLSRAAFEAANAGDEVAIGLLESMGHNGAETVLGTIRQAGFEPHESVEVILAGSLYVKAESRILISAFQDTVAAALGDRVRFHLLREPPVAGAVLWALEDLNGPSPRELRRRVLESCLTVAYSA